MTTSSNNIFTASVILVKTSVRLSSLECKLGMVPTSFICHGDCEKRGTIEVKTPGVLQSTKQMKTFNGMTGKNDAKSHSFNTGNPISNTCGLIKEQNVVLPYLYFRELIQKVLLV